VGSEKERLERQSGGSSVTLKEVASRAGVSKSTVSRVLNNRLGEGFSVSEKLRRRVIGAARELHYRPNLVARSLANTDSRMISVFGDVHALSKFGNIFQAAVNSLAESLGAAPEKFDVIVDVSVHKPESSELPFWSICGAVVLGRCSSVTMGQLELAGVPYVVINGPCGASGCSVVPDDIDGMRKAVRHLIELGHRRIAYAGPLPGHSVGHSSLEDRRRTYLSELAGSGLSAIDGHNETLESAAGFLKSVVLGRGATAIIAYGQIEGLNLMQAAQGLGISVPEQLSLICFGDEYACNVMSPGLTFVDLQSEQMGRLAAKLLLRQIRSVDEPRREVVTLPERLIIRESTALRK
jgi:LacI family transcriptional regulator